MVRWEEWMEAASPERIEFVQVLEGLAEQRIALKVHEWFGGAPWALLKLDCAFPFTPRARATLKRWDAMHSALCRRRMRSSLR
jgi:hypothetical protein